MQKNISNEWPGARYDYYSWAPNRNVRLELERFQYSSEAAPHMDFDKVVDTWQEVLVEQGRTRDQRKLPIRVGDFSGFELSGANDKGNRCRIRLLQRGKVVYFQLANEFGDPKGIAWDRFVESLQVRQ